MALKFGTFRVEKEEVSLDNKAPKAVSHHLSAAPTNAQCELDCEGRKKIAIIEKYPTWQGAIWEGQFKRQLN